MDSFKNNDFQQKNAKRGQGGKSRARTNQEREWKPNGPLRYYNTFRYQC